MLASFLRSWLTPKLPTLDRPRLYVPEWSEPMGEQQSAIWWKVKSYTTSDAEHIVALCQSIAYLEKHGIPGAIVECGVGKGGNMMAAALALLALDSTQRQLFFFDTGAHGTLQEVKQTMMRTRYPWEKMIFIKGRVEETIPTHAPEQIALLCINVDEQASTRHTLEHLRPRLAADGILMADDDGHETRPELKSAA